MIGSGRRPEVGDGLELLAGKGTPSSKLEVVVVVIGEPSGMASLAGGNVSKSGGTVGVLIIGSLFWSDACHRQMWRRDRLDQYRGRYVSAPIRYGRWSTTRKSYTMVFSTNLDREGEYGRAIVVPCRRRVESAADVVDEAVHLWTAETPDGKNPKCRVSAPEGWGCVGLLPNPHRPLPAALRAGWTQRVSNEPSYGQLSAADNEKAAVDETGLLTIPWPESEDGLGLDVDVLLATATNPTIVEGRYPTTQEIAEAWNGSPGNVEYFYKNRTHGITTFEDAAIEADLKTGKL